MGIKCMEFFTAIRCVTNTFDDPYRISWGYMDA